MYEEKIWFSRKSKKTTGQFIFDTLLENPTQKVRGKLVKTINKTIETKGFRVDGINWNGLDEFGDPLAKGVYIYRVKIKNDLGETAEKSEKLVILR